MYGYATPAHTHDFTNSASGATITATCSADGCDLDDGTEQHNHTATLTIAADEYSSKYYANGAAPMGIIETPTLIKNPDLLRQSWNEAFGGTRNAGKVAVLEQGTTFKPISLSPQDSQLLDTRKFSVEEICRIFRVPPHLVQDLGRATFTLNGRLICGKCGRTLKRYVKLDDALIDWRCRQRALVKKTDFHEDVSTRCDCRIVREVEAQRTVVMAFNTLPSRREELVVLRERLLTGEIGRIDALLKTLDGQQDRLEERLEVLASQVPEDEEPMNTTVVDEVGSTQVITSEMDEAAFLRSQIVEIRRRKDGFYAERAEHANTEVQIRLLLELVDEMVKNSLPEWMQTHASSDALKNDAVITGGSADGGGGAQEIETDGSCRDFDDFFNRTKYIVPEGVLDENGRMERFKNNLVIRYMDKMVVKDDGYEVAFKAGVRVEVKV
ncbi:MAG: phage portal protein [Clostridia bacterium]|nr:phage portal protein [Clostridia bacterium]